MEHQQTCGSGNQEVKPAVADNEGKGSTYTATSGGIVNAPQLRETNIGNNLIINNYMTNVQPNAVTTNSKENVKKCQDLLKSYLLKQTETLVQGIKEADSNTPINKVYTELYVTEGGGGEVNSEHEVIELESTLCTSEERKIQLDDIFKPLSDEEGAPQRVLTKGIAGIGKTVAVQKFTHDWAAGRQNQSIQFVFPFTFRELNSIKDECWSLKDLIHHYFEEEVKDLEASDYTSPGVLFILDGLDESKFPLNFEENGLCLSLTKKAEIDVLLTNLISGKLLTQALVWITSRPAAAGKIPLKFINRITEVRGFNEDQRKEYFQKIIINENMFQKIFHHLQSKPLRSLYILCHIPMFCWISATVLQSLYTQSREAELPKTLTEMYTHFLICQTKWKQEKDYQVVESDGDLIMKLGKLAFEQLKKGNIIFKENDLKDCEIEIDLKQAAVYSGVCTQIIRKEHGLYREEFYSFIHLSVQEFLAALYVLETFINKRENLLGWSNVRVVSQDRDIPIIFLHKQAVDDTLTSDYGQWDLFLRFLLGLSQDKNQQLLQKVFKERKHCSQNNQETINYIHNKISKLSYTNISINLFHCLNELGDNSLVEQVQNYQRSGDVSEISGSHWSALAFVLLTSNEDLSVFDLSKYCRSDEVLKRLLPVLKEAKTALLRDCRLTDRCCRYISSVLSFKASVLKKLDLSRNKLKDTGMKLLSDGLKNPNCKLQRLRLSNTNLQKEGAAKLASALLLNPSHLRELDLGENNLGDDGVKEIAALLRHSQCKMDTLRLVGCRFSQYRCVALASSLKSNPAHLRVLNLSRNNIRDSGAKNLSAEFLADPQCRLETLNLKCCTLTLAHPLTSALSGSSVLKELDLSYNPLTEQELQHLCDWAGSPHRRLNITEMDTRSISWRH